ncbi:MAG: hypothetical protein RL514_1695 [Verrucomicrobiota bacterium]
MTVGLVAQNAPSPSVRPNDGSRATPDEVRAAAARGEAEAQFFLGRALFRGEGVAQDVPAAVEWLERAAEQGVLEAQLMAGAARERGIGGRIDFAQAMAWYRRAADQGNAGAQLRLGLLHVNNRPGGKVDFTGATNLLQPLAKQGYAVARFAAAFLEPHGPPNRGVTNLFQAGRWLIASARDGAATAQWQLGTRYELGRGTKPDFIEAAKWYDLAARQGHTDAARALAKLSAKLSRAERAEAKQLADDFVTKPTVPLPAETLAALYYLNPVGASSPAFTQLQAAAAKGDAAAQFQLGLTLLLREDSAHLKAALERGWGMSNGKITSGGNLPAPHETEAAKWLKASAEQGNTGAQFQLALHFLDPLSRSTNTVEGLRWLQAAAKGRVVAAQFQLARFHQEGGPVRKDAMEAVRWLRSAAERGHASAQTNLATLLMDPKLMGADYGEGVRWLRMAAAAGHPQAQRDVRRIFGAGFNLTVAPAAPPSPAPPVAAPGSPASGSLKLAIVAPGAETRPVADLLTVSLSQAPGVTLLERTEIDRVWREQSLAAAGRGSLVKLGEVLGADGVLLMETNSAAGQTNLSARLVAVKTGVTLGQLAVALPLADVTEWSGRAAAQFLQWLPKAAVARQDAVPVSILNLRSALNTTRAVALERDLTSLLTERLLRQREVFVLERRRMDQLTAERELGGEVESAFWSGSYLLEGVINKDGEQAGRVTVHGRLIPPGGGTATQVEVEGERTELPQLVNALAGKIFTSLHRSPTDAAWGTPEEAAKYFEEARWASRWGMRPEARAAADAAWALGLRGVELATVRLAGWTAELQATTAWREEARQTARGYLVALRPPDPRQLEMALQALSFFTSYGNLPADTEPELVFTWLSTGLRAVDHSTSVLRHYYRAIEAGRDQGKALAELRALARTSFERVAASPLVTNGVLQVQVRQVRPNGTTVFDRKVELLPTRAAGGSYWVGDVSQGRAWLAELVTHPAYFSTLRGELLRPFPLTCWTVAERQAAPQAWAALVDEWGRSTNAALRIEGQLRRFEALPATTDAAVQTQAAKLLDLVWELRTNLFTGVISPHVSQLILTAALTKLREGPNGREVVTERNSSGNLQTIHRNREDAALLGPFDLKWKEFGEAYRKEQEAEQQRLTELAARRSWEEHKEYLRTAKAYDDGRFTSQYLHRQYTRAEMEELLPLLQPYGERMGWPVWPRSVADRMSRALNPPTNSVVPKAVIQASAPRPPPKVVHPNAPAGPTNVLQATRFWTPPAELFPDPRVRPSGPLNLQFAAGRIWTGLRYTTNYGQGDELMLVALEPDTLRAQTYVLPKPERTLPERDGWMNALFPGYVVWDGHVYLHLGDRLKRLRLGGARWEDLPASVPDNATLFVVHGRLYFSAADSILELNEAGDGTRLLASTRRRPAETPLDTLGTLGSPPVFPGPGGRVRVWTSARLFEHDPRARTWREIVAPPQQQTIVRELNVTLATRGGYPMGRQSWFGVFDDESEWSHLYDTAPPAYAGQPPSAGSSAKTRWRVPAPFDPYLPPAASLGKDLWSLHGWLATEARPGGGFRWKPVGDRHATLMFFPAGRSAPYLIPLWLEASAKGAGLPQNPMHNSAMSPQTKLIATGDGVIITDKRVPAGFWVLTKAELEPFFQAQERLTLEHHRARQESEAAQLVRMKKSLLAQFDTNANGVLEPDEERAARANPIYQRLLDQETAARWFKAFDANGDGLLDAPEYAAFRAQPPELEGRKWTPPPFAEALQFDLNRDQRLNQRELASLLPHATKSRTEAKKP